MAIAAEQILKSLTEALYPGVDLTVTYENERLEKEKLRLFKFTSNHDCILHFKRVDDFGIDALILRAAQPRVLCLPYREVDIDFEVYSKVGPPKKLSDPPPIKP